jgi:hypothetical protein
MTPLEPGADNAAAVTVNHTGLDRDRAHVLAALPGTLP